MDQNTPKIGMIFENMDDAWEYWKQYGDQMGFSVRKHLVRKSKIDKLVISRTFCCSREGTRLHDKRRAENAKQQWETRCGCPARMDCILIRETKKISVKNFVESHNHELEPPETRHMLRSRREVSKAHRHQIEMTHDAGLRPCRAHELIAVEASGRSKVSYTVEDQKTFLRVKRQRNMELGEAGAILSYFEKKKLQNPLFFNDMQLDKEDCVTNLFWADPEMIVDYQAFGDVVIFDMTYGTNKGLRPFGVFTGFNHHRTTVVFGAALLYDEMTDSFIWLFETFLKCHGGRAPQTVFTDQNVTMAKALTLVMPSTWHGLCTWHIMQNATKHLGGRDGLLSEFSKCMFEYEDETQFEGVWSIMVSAEEGTNARLWLDGIYCLRHKWAACFTKNVFTLGIRSTQLSKSLNSDLKNHWRCDINVRDFFHHFDKVLEKKRHKELSAEYESRQKIPNLIMIDCPIMIQASKIYSPTIFKLVQVELLKVMSMCVLSRQGHTYVLGLYTDPSATYHISFDLQTQIVQCRCRMFETSGILCSHAFKIFNIHDLRSIPEKYILRRWTRKARDDDIPDVSSQNLPNLEDSHAWLGCISTRFTRSCLRIANDFEWRKKLEEKVAEIERFVQSFSNVEFEESSANVIPTQITDSIVKRLKVERTSSSIEIHNDMP